MSCGSMKNFSPLLFIGMTVVAGAQIASAQPQTILTLIIDDVGRANCNVQVDLSLRTKWMDFLKEDQNPIVPVYVILPFRITDPALLQVPEHLFFTLKIPEIARDYSLVTVFIPRQMNSLTFSVKSAINPTLTVEAKSKLTIDFFFRDAHEALLAFMKRQNSVSDFDILVRSNIKLSNDEISSEPLVAFQRISDDPTEFLATFDRIPINNKRVAFIYPNLGSRKEKQFLFLILLIIGAGTSLFQLFPIKRRHKLYMLCRCSTQYFSIRWSWSFLCQVAAGELPERACVCCSLYTPCVYGNRRNHLLDRNHEIPRKGERTSH